MSMPATSTKTTKLATSLIDEYALLGWRAMLTEVNLSPKPGLVDRINCGAHKDMALGNDSNLLIVFYVQIMPDDFVMQLHRF